MTVYNKLRFSYSPPPINFALHGETKIKEEKRLQNLKANKPQNNLNRHLTLNLPHPLVLIPNHL